MYTPESGVEDHAHPQSSPRFFCQMFVASHHDSAGNQEFLLFSWKLLLSDVLLALYLLVIRSSSSSSAPTSPPTSSSTHSSGMTRVWITLDALALKAGRGVTVVPVTVWSVHVRCARPGLLWCMLASTDETTLTRRCVSSWALGTAFSGLLASPVVGLSQTLFTRLLLFRLRTLVRDRKKDFIAYFQGEVVKAGRDCAEGGWGRNASTRVGRQPPVSGTSDWINPVPGVGQLIWYAVRFS
jgi:hypothetical protein